MRHDIVGVVLLCISAFLYAARYVTAAILMGSRLKSWSPEYFKAAYGCLGNGLTAWSVLALFAGLGVIVSGVVVQAREQKTEHERPDLDDASHGASSATLVEKRKDDAQNNR